MPTGTTLEQCEADYKPAADFNTQDAQMFAVKCVELDLLPSSKT